MSYDAKVFNVMIASPGDVDDERDIIREVLYEWNAVNSQSRKIVLLPVGWESHSSPEMGNHPQAIINHQVLDKCDLLVGIFGIRIGTQTIEYASGTVEEIEKHIINNRPTMLYFSDQPVKPSAIKHEQYSQLEEFKKSCETRGLYGNYDSLQDFKEKFRRQLHIKLNNHPLFSNIELNQANDVIESLNNLEKLLASLTDNAKQLLKNTSLDFDGRLFFIRGSLLQTNRKSFIRNFSDRREVACWEEAIKDLVKKELLVPVGEKKQTFEVTNLGYQIADIIEI